jgi:hypothetical protein
MVIKETTPPQEIETTEKVIQAVVEEVVQEQPQMLTVEAVDEIAPEFVEMLQPQVVSEGDTVTMTCRLIGSPPPSITWFRNTEELQSGPDVRLYYETSTGVCTLEITEVFPDDAGEIVCRAVNPFGEASTSATLLVQGKLCVCVGGGGGLFVFLFLLLLSEPVYIKVRTTFISKLSKEKSMNFG